MCVVVGIAMVVAMVAVPAASAQTPVGDTVTGQVCDLLFPAEPCEFATFFEADARSGPSGENPTGTAEWGFRVGPQRFVFEGPVTCLAVTGSTAVIGFTGTPGLGRTLARVVDGGRAPGQDSFEAITQVDLGGSPVPPPDCSTFPPSPAGTVSLSRSGVNEVGDIVVRDAQPLPLSTAQCKNGAWKSYGVFRNQGDCVSFVATKGKNQPAGP
jgi:hypothetical protein